MAEALLFKEEIKMMATEQAIPTIRKTTTLAQMMTTSP
jgi:hypothetical protein